MKLYISYYGNYVSIVEGVYNAKKDKYNIKNVTFLSEEDVKLDGNDRYGLLREALRLNKSKVKNVVFSLNTRDVIIKPNNVQKVSPKDLDGIMNNEMYEMMSLDYDEYTFSYEVLNEKEVDGEEILDVVVAAISNDELDIILSVFKEFKLNIERIDTMTTSYSRLLKKVEYEDMMVINTGRYGSFVNIYENDSLFIYDNIPVRINDNSNYAVALALVDEVKGLTNFYSSRHFGKTLDNILLVGESNNNQYVKESFDESFNGKVIVGIENLFDIEEDLQGDIQGFEISKACDVIGSMCEPKDKKGYKNINLLPMHLRDKQRKNELLKNGLVVVPVVVGVLALPYIGFGVLNSSVEKQTQLAQGRLDEILIEFQGIQDIDAQISKAKDEIGIYDMLNSKYVKWGDVLASIDKNIPYRADLTNIDVYYDSSIDESESSENTESQNQTNENSDESSNNNEDSSNNEENNNGENTESTDEETETAIYDQIPNVIEIQGIAITPEKIGQFVYSLNKLTYFKSVELKSSAEDEENGGYTFHIVLVLREGVVSGE